jgi:hypothetical protein
MTDEASGRHVRDLPRTNRAQNKQLKDAARDENLNSDQRRKLGRIIEKEYRERGIPHDYTTIREVAKEIKEGKL